MACCSSSRLLFISSMEEDRMKFLSSGIITGIFWALYINLFHIQMLEAINQSFLYGLVFLMAGIGAVIARTGFFSPLAVILREGNLLWRSKHRLVIAAEQDMQEKIKKRNTSSFIKVSTVTLGMGTSLTCCSIISMIVYY